MNNRYTNRIDMSRTVIALLDDPTHLAAWQGQPPLQFGTKAASLRTAVESFAATAARQSAVITGAALDKERNEALLEDLAHELGSLLADYFHDENREQSAAAVDFPISAWRRLRGEHLLNRANLLATTLARALAADAAALAGYGLTPDDSTALAAAIDAYRDSIAQPSGAIAERKALTGSLDAAYRAVATLLESMDRLVLRFRGTDGGRAFAAAWQAARIIRDYGHGPATPPPAPSPVPAPPQP